MDKIAAPLPILVEGLKKARGDRFFFSVQRNAVVIVLSSNVIVLSSKRSKLLQACLVSTAEIPVLLVA